jgi:hypothetical protein
MVTVTTPAAEKARVAAARAVNKVLKSGLHGSHLVSGLVAAINSGAGGHGALAQHGVGGNAGIVSPDAGHVGAARGEGGEGDSTSAGQVDLDAGQALGKGVGGQAGGVNQVQLEVACRQGGEARGWMGWVGGQGGESGSCTSSHMRVQATCTCRFRQPHVGSQ